MSESINWLFVVHAYIKRRQPFLSFCISSDLLVNYNVADEPNTGPELHSVLTRCGQGIRVVYKPPDVPERCIPLHFDNTPSDPSQLAVLRILPVVWETFKAYSEEFMDYIQARTT